MSKMYLCWARTRALLKYTRARMRKEYMRACESVDARMRE